MSEFIEEPLHKGLYSAKNSRFNPPGSLSAAKGARYKGGDIAVWPADGRALVGSGGHSNAPIANLFGRRWPDDTVKVAGVPELQQLFYEAIEGIRSLPADANPRSTAMNAALSTLVIDGVGSPGFAIEFDRDLHIFGPRARRVIRRPKNVNGDPEPQIAFSLWRSIDVPDEITALQPLVAPYTAPEVPLLGQSTGLYFRRTGGSGGFEANHYYWFWATPYDSVNDIEYATDIWPHFNATSRVEQPLIGHFFISGVTNSLIDIFMEEQAFIKHFSGVDKMRLYMADPVAATVATELLNPFPVGYRIAEITLAGLPVESLFSPPLRMVRIKTAYTTVTPMNLDHHHANPTYPTVTVSTNGIDVITNRNHSINKGTAVEVFNDSIVVADRNKTRFSAQGDGYAFPPAYEINHGIDVYDEVVQYAALNRVLAVFFTDRVERVNSLPTNEDFNFGNARTRDVIIPDEGIVGPRALCKFTLSIHSMVAWVSERGLRVTDAHDVLELVTRNLDWPALVGKNLSSSILINNADEWRLEFYYNVDGGIANNALYFHYHPDNVDEKGLPVVMGPIARPGGVAGAAVVRTTSGKMVVVTSDSHGRLFYEGESNLDESDGSSIPFSVVTREIFPFGKGRHGQIVGTGVDVKSAPGSGEMSFTFNGKPSSTIPTGVLTEKKITPDDLATGFALKAISDEIERYTIELSSSGASGVAVNSVGVFAELAAREPSRRSP